MHYFVNGTRLQYEASGDRCRGERRCLLNHADDLTRNHPWASAGFTIEQLYSPQMFASFHRQVLELLHSLWRSAGLDTAALTTPEDYHRIASDRATHLKALEKTKLISTDRFPMGITLLEERISAICGFPLHVFNPVTREKVFHFRVVRPKTGDQNPLHRDVWLPDYADCINLYIPIAGSDQHSSLIIAPGSHLLEEHDLERTATGAIINEQRFNVPALTRLFKDVAFVRPDPKLNEVLVFSPYLIHGGSVNLNHDATRVSLEVRLWRKKPDSIEG